MSTLILIDFSSCQVTYRYTHEETNSEGPRQRTQQFKDLHETSQYSFMMHSTDRRLDVEDIQVYPQRSLHTPKHIHESPNKCSLRYRTT